MANYMTEVAKMFGVELGEVFKIVDDNSGKYHNYYRLTEEKGIEVSDDNADWDAAIAGVLKWLLMGDVRIVKLPWKPQIREKYYVPRIAIRPKDRYYWYHWQNSDADIKRYDMGIVCKTSEEAVALTKKMLMVVTGE